MTEFDALTPCGWDDYELIDCGDHEKLERWGRWVTRRPEPQAVWRKTLPEEEWERGATAVFRRESRGSGDGERGEWTLAPNMPGQWWIGYRYKEMALQMRLGLTAFKHVGVFPEQAANWDFIYDRCREMTAYMAGTRRKPQILNLFAYTGGATLAALAAGAQVTHVDSVKQVVGWARENMERSGLDGARWIVDDALKFVRREARRGKIYDGIILDPPAYGRGPDGERWVLEQQIGEMLELCAALLSPVDSFLVLNLYSMGLSPLIAQTAVRQMFGIARDERFGELYFTDRAGKNLPLGVYYRMVR
ncbi:MAG: class I SAM-dependent methyltransferase [Rikenellaceae bacterium]|nr:class I SAM-dependent methyltransferase [Rikenellaceae bacterium]MCL2691959.1 class I SAM-dependent methyltransferase [Rikenellaceae bacterium]